MPCTPRTVPRTPRCLALCKDPTVNVVLAMKIQTVCYEIFYMISAHIWISHNALL